MTKSFCELLRQYYPKPSEADDFNSTFIANCVLNSFLSYTAIMLNIVTIHAIRKTPSLPKTLKTLLLSLAVSDVGVGLLVQPLYSSVLVKWLQQNNPGCNTAKAFYVVAHLFFNSSFSNVVAVSVDRFLAIHLHLRYHEHVTHKRVVSLVISIWLLSLLISLTPLWLPSQIFNPIIVTLAFVGLVFIAMVYIRIYLTVRRHNGQIHTLQVQHGTKTGEKAQFAILVKSAFGTFYVYLLLLICYLPHLICMAVIEVNGTRIALKKLFLLSMTLVFLNSVLNPVIYCWKMRPIRRIITDIGRNVISWLSNRSSH